MLALLLQPSLAQMPGMDQLPKKPKPAPLNKDLPFIRCQTCEIMTHKALKQVKTLIAETAPTAEKKRRFDHSSNLGGLEAQVDDLLSAICNSEAKEGSWLADYDVVKRGSALKLENQVGGDVAGGHLSLIHI